MNVINYTFDTDGVGEMNYTFKPAISKVLSVHVRSENHQVLMNIEVESVFDGDDLTAFNDFFLNWAVAFGFEFSVPVRELRNCGHSLPRKEGARNYQLNLGPITFSVPRKPMTPSEERLNHVSASSLQVTSEQLIYLRQFAFANSESDAISRFSFLYNLLLQMSGDEQAKVNSSILKIAPDCEQSISPLNRKPETVYTRLRNELAHKRQGTRYSETKLEISSNIDEFSELVKEIIKRF